MRLCAYLHTEVLLYLDLVGRHMGSNLGVDLRMRSRAGNQHCFFCSVLLRLFARFAFFTPSSHSSFFLLIQLVS